MAATNMAAANMAATRLSEASGIVVSKDQVSSDLAGETAILNLKNGVYYGLDPVGSRIWTLVQEPTTFGQILDTLLDHYDVEKVTLESDIRNLLSQLAEHGLIEIQA